MDSFTTFSNSTENAKPLTVDDLKKAMEEIAKMPKPEALIFIPSIVGLTMFKIDDDIARDALLKNTERNIKKLNKHRG